MTQDRYGGSGRDDARYEAILQAQIVNLHDEIDRFKRDECSLHAQIAGLQCWLQDAQEQITQLMANPPTPVRHRLEDEVAALKKQLEDEKRELAKEKAKNASLQRQLQAEKEDNAQRSGRNQTGKAIPGVTGNNDNENNDDDDEEPESVRIKQEAKREHGEYGFAPARPVPPRRLEATRPLTASRNLGAALDPPPPRAPSQRRDVPHGPIRHQTPFKRRAAIVEPIPQRDSATMYPMPQRDPAVMKPIPRRGATFEFPHRQAAHAGMSSFSPTQNPTSIETLPRKRQRQTTALGRIIPSAKSVINNGKFIFLMISGYPSAAEILSYEAVQMMDCVPELWDGIYKVLTDIWERRKGEEWQDEFTKSGYDRTKKSCITSKFLHLKGDWREGCEGRFACGHCVRNRRPCFTYKGAEDEFWLLPLHSDDRIKHISKGKEVRYWVNS